MTCPNCGAEIADGLKFCTECGMPIQASKMAAENESANVDYNYSKQSDPAGHPPTVDSDYQQNTAGSSIQSSWDDIIQKNIPYYTEEFEKLDKGEQSKFNWAAFWLNLFFCFYRKCGDICKRYFLYPIIIGLSGEVVSAVGASSFSIPVMIVGSVIGLIGSIWNFVNAIRLGKNFNKEYYQHCKHILAKNDKSKYGTSIGAGILSVIVFSIIVGVLSMVISSTTTASMLGSIADAGTDYSDFNYQESEPEQGSSGNVSTPMQSAPANTSKTNSNTTSSSPTSPSKAQPHDAYSDILEKNHTALVEGWDYWTLCNEDLTIWIDGGSLYDIGYTYLDLNNDGTDELLIVPVYTEADESGLYYSLYTLVNGRPVLVDCPSERSSSSVCQRADGAFAIISSGSYGANCRSVSFSTVMPNGDLEWIEGFSIEYEEGGFVKYEYSPDGVYYRFMSEDEIDSIYQKYYIVEFNQITPFSSMGSGNAYTGSVATPNTSTADGRLLNFVTNCDKQYFSRSDLNGFDASMAILARNAPYAHAGRKFSNDTIRTYFEQFSWYYPLIEPDAFQETMLNSYETANKDLIVAYEKEMGYK